MAFPLAARTRQMNTVNEMGSARRTIPATHKRADIIKVARTLKGIPMCEEYEKMISGML